MEKIAKLTPFLSASPQIKESDLGVIKTQGFKAIICNRPDGEGDDQPTAAALETAARENGLDFRYIPVVSGKVEDGDVEAFETAMAEIRGPVLAFCRTGTRSTTLWALSEAAHLSPEALLKTAKEAGYDLEALRPRLEARWAEGPRVEGAKKPAKRKAAEMATPASTYDVVVVGGGAAGIAVASGLLRQKPGISIAVVEPREHHYYQPGWTLVGGGVFERGQTERAMASVMPRKVNWVRAAVSAFEPDKDQVVLEDGKRLGYRTLVAAPGIKLNWDGVKGLRETLGKNGVTSNYQFEMAPYTWELVQSLRGGRAIFTQPPMPIKCAGAPQKAMYLACDHWRRTGVLKEIQVEFDAHAPVLFGVKEFVPPLMTYVERYGAELCLNTNLVEIDGPAKKAWFEVSQGEGKKLKRIEKSFDMIHVCPPQTAPDFVRESPLANEAGWIEVSPETMAHVRYGNVFALGDACSAPNAKTAAAVRKQAPVVVENVIATLAGRGPRAIYDGYGSCPLTVERGRIVLAEFGYGGKLLPTFPKALINPTKPSRLAWLLKEKLLPWVYWDLMLKGRNWLVGTERLPHEPGAYEAQEALASNDRGNDRGPAKAA